MTNWRRSPKVYAPNRPKDQNGGQPAHKCGRPPRACATLDHAALPPCHEVAGIQNALPFERRAVQYGSDGMGVMGGKLRVNAIRHGQQLLRATDVAAYRYAVLWPAPENLGAPQPAPI